MKYINVGILEMFDAKDIKEASTEKDSTTDTGYTIHAKVCDCYMNIEAVDELWFMYSFKSSTVSGGGEYYPFIALDSSKTNICSVRLINTSVGLCLGVYDKNDNLIYTSPNTINIFDDSYHTIEFHMKTGESSRIDVWVDTKLFCSYRSPSIFSGSISYVGFHKTNSDYSFYLSQFIAQDTRRIGLEKFVKLTVAPATEQTIPQGSTTSFTLSGLSDATEYSDITSVCALINTTSKDANITEGTFSIDGSKIGTVDVSSSNTNSYEIVHSETNAQTTKPWTRDNIEGKMMTFTVNGAS